MKQKSTKGRLADMILVHPDLRNGYVSLNVEARKEIDTVPDSIHKDEDRYKKALMMLNDQSIPLLELQELIRAPIDILTRRWQIVNRHHKEETFKLAYYNGHIMNVFETRVVKVEKRKKAEFTEWRQKAFSHIKARYLQRWQQVAELGEFVLQFAYLGIDSVSELKYLFDIEKEGEKEESKIARESIKGFLDMVRGSTNDQACMRNAMDAAISLARLLKAKYPEGLLNDKELILLIVRQKRAALESKDAKYLVKAYNETPEDKKKTHLRDFARDKSAFKRLEPIEKPNNVRSLNEVLEKFNSRFIEALNKEKGISITPETLIDAYKHIQRYAQENNINLTTSQKRS